MRQWLNKPYPFLLEDQTTRFKIGLFVLVFVFFFLLVFQPFHLKEVIDVDLYSACTLYAFTSAFVAFTFVTILVKTFPKYANEQKWTIAKEFLMMSSILMMISLANFIMGRVVELHPNDVNVWYQLKDDVLHTFAIGLFPIMVITFTNYTVLLRRNLSHAERHNVQLNERETESLLESKVRLLISSTTANNDIELKLDDIVFLMADGNYIEFHFEKDGEIVREIRRNTLNNIADQLEVYSNFFRSHRAYMVNLNKIIESKGNAQGYQLRLKGIEQLIPVSRGKLNQFDKLMAQGTRLLEQYST